MRAPGWVSARRSLQRKARDLPSTPSFSQLAPFYATALKSGLHQDPAAFPHLFSAVIHAGDSSLAAFRQLHRHSAVSGHLSAVPSLLSGGAATSSAAVHGVALKLGVLACTLLANSLLSALCKSASHARAGSMAAALKLFDEMPERDAASWSAIVAGFVRAGDMAAARATFDAMPAKDSVSWAAVVSGFAARGMLAEALRSFDEMEGSGFQPDDTALAKVLSRCGWSGLLPLGERVHRSIERRRVPCGTHVWNALIDMYSKCGDIKRALKVFENMGRRNVVSWNVLLLGLARHGRGRKVVHMLSEMERDGFRPDKVTFIGVLSGCAHAGLVHEGVRYLGAMDGRYGVRPEIEHYGCVVDLLGRGGYLEEAFEMVHRMGVEPNYVIGGTLLRSCRAHDSTRLADVASRYSNKVRPSNDGAILVQGRWGGVCGGRIVNRGEVAADEKMFGSSSIKVDSKVRVFRSFDAFVCPSLEGMVRRLSRHIIARC